MIARVNDQIITRSEYERSEQQMMQETQQDNAAPAEAEEKQQDLLRDMIDQQLLLSKGKELGITGDAETMRRLDDIRKQNHLDSMEALEKAAEQQGISFEDFKAHSQRVITHQVVPRRGGPSPAPDPGAGKAYYKAHSRTSRSLSRCASARSSFPRPTTPTTQPSPGAGEGR